MKNKLIASISSLFLVSSLQAQKYHYVGGDISLFPEYENAGSIYKDTEGNKISLLPFLKEEGMNAMRVRLFVDPAAFEANHPNDYDPNACQSLPYIIPLCQDIVENGFDLMLDFHYSDTWADPGAQWIPDAWKDLDDEQLSEKIYDYTKETLVTLKSKGITPAFIQPGNEISYGMLWGTYGHDVSGNHTLTSSSEASWKRFGDFLRSATAACREVCPEAKIVIHTERVAQVGVLQNFYNRMETLGIDYDIIGLSYYPYHHGPLTNLNSALIMVEKNYPDKDIMIVETGCPIWYSMGNGTNYPLNLNGENQYAEELVETLLSHPNVTGLFWWWLEYNPYGTQLTGWYDAPLFDPKTGKATPALKTLCKFADTNAGVVSIVDDNLDNEYWYDLNGRKYSKPQKPGLYIHKGDKIMVKP